MRHNFSGLHQSYLVHSGILPFNLTEVGKTSCQSTVAAGYITTEDADYNDDATTSFTNSETTNSMRTAGMTGTSFANGDEATTDEVMTDETTTSLTNTNAITSSMLTTDVVTINPSNNPSTTIDTSTSVSTITDATNENVMETTGLISRASTTSDSTSDSEATMSMDASSSTEVANLSPTQPSSEFSTTSSNDNVGKKNDPVLLCFASVFSRICLYCIVTLCANLLVQKHPCR